MKEIIIPKKFAENFKNAVDYYSRKQPERLILLPANQVPEYPRGATKLLRSYGQNPEDAHHLWLVNPGYEINHRMISA